MARWPMVKMFSVMAELGCLLSVCSRNLVPSILAISSMYSLSQSPHFILYITPYFYMKYVDALIVQLWRNKIIFVKLLSTMCLCVTCVLTPQHLEQCLTCVKNQPRTTSYTHWLSALFLHVSPPRSHLGVLTWLFLPYTAGCELPISCAPGGVWSPSTSAG